MEKREFIIKLIEQDIKHNQLTNGLEEIGLYDNERYTLGIVWLVADMMGQEEGEVPLHSPHNTATKRCQYWHNPL
jgi:hypothetical protein